MCNIPSLQTEQDVLRDLNRFDNIRAEVDELVIMRSCQWSKIKPHIKIKSKMSKFIGQTKITQADILNAVSRNEFFGICKVQISTPPDVIEKLKSLNFPLLFDKKEITEQMLDAKMQTIANAANREFPYTAMTLCYNSDHRLITTPLLAFYMKLGLKIHKLYYAVEYIQQSPFTAFVNELVDVRVKSVGVNPALGDR